MDLDTLFFAEGGCTCRATRYRITTAPLFVHCCRCRWCQRESGASFALNALIESDRVIIRAGTPEEVNTPSASGKGQRIFRCPHCRVAVWSHYSGAGNSLRFVRVGTLAEGEPRQAPGAVDQGGVGQTPSRGAGRCICEASLSSLAASY
jgi:hypothetical protein